MLLYKRFYNKWSGDAQGRQSEITYECIQAIANSGNKQAQNEFKVIKKMKEEQDKLKSHLKMEKSGRRCLAAAAYITFETKEQRDDVYRHYQKSPLARFLYSFCGCFYKKSVNIFHGTYLKVKAAPAPNTILWANLDIDSTEKFFRRLVSWVITAGFWAISNYHYFITFYHIFF